MAALEVAGGLRALKKILRADVGFFEKDILYRAGQVGGSDFFRKRTEGGSPDSATDILKTITAAISSEGMGDYRLERADEELKTAIVTTRDSFETLGSEESTSPEDGPSCSYTAGFLSEICKLAFADESTGKDEIFAHEIECISQGKDRCRFIVAPRCELERQGFEVDLREESTSEHYLRLNEQILLRNLELQNLALTLERNARKRTEELKKAEENYRSLIDLSPDPILIAAMDGRIVSANQALMDLLGQMDKGKVEGANLEELMSEGTGAFSRLRWYLDKDGTVHNFEISLKTEKNGTITVEASARIAEMDRERRIQAILRDVTERNELEKQLVEAKEEADFLNDLLSHDIINYMFAAMHFVERLEKSENLSETEGRSLRTVSKAVRGAYEFSSVVRDARRAKDLSFRDREPRDLQTALREAIEEIKRMYCDRNVTVAFEPPSAPCKVVGNALLTRLFSNLLTNAVKFDPNDEVVIDVSIVQVEGNPGYWQVRIADRGRGIPDEDKSKVFDRYYRRDASIPGTGLGLHLASRIVGSCGGTIELENRVDGDHRKGTVVVTNLRSANGPSNHEA
ncbi:TPA: PAS domain S-box protein [Thermoplasmata archaeon]|nr:PAS domain S-box protein [Thermoplasmata archaeon]